MRLTDSKTLIINNPITILIPDILIILTFLGLGVDLYYSTFPDIFSGLLILLGVIIPSWSIIRKTKISAPFYILLDTNKKTIKLSYYISRARIIDFSDIQYLLLLDVERDNKSRGGGYIQKYSTVWILDNSNSIHLIHLSSDNAKSFLNDLSQKINCKTGKSPKIIKLNHMDVSNNNSNLIKIDKEELDITDLVESYIK